MINQLQFDSVKCPEGKRLSLACGHISLNEIVFVHEHISVQVEAKTGDVVFYDENGGKLLSTQMTTPTSGDEKFSDLFCRATDGQISLGFPRYTYEDTYPNCDGESDRWKKTIWEYRTILYLIESNRIVY